MAGQSKLLHHKLRDSPGGSGTSKLQFESELATGFRRQLTREEDDNSGVDAARAAKNAARRTLYAAHSSSRKGTEPPSDGRSTAQRQQTRRIRQEYSSSHSSTAKTAAQKAQEQIKAGAAKLVHFVQEHSSVLLPLVLLAGAILLVCGIFSSCTALSAGTGNVVLATTYTATDEDILGAEKDYTTLESALQTEIDSIPSTYPDYDEYTYNLAQIGHDPYELASYLTVLYEDYTREEVQSTLSALLDGQYTLTLTPETETRTRTETQTTMDPETGETTETEVQETYEYKTLTVTLINAGLDSVIRSSGLTEEQLERYTLLCETKGNRSDLFADNPYVQVSASSPSYEIPVEALTDTKFANLIREGEKYLGYPYVWGGSSPSTSFDCSGFVCWVLNNCGNGWNVGRTNCNGLLSNCQVISPSEAQPGDLIFFQGTYNTTGASHVGIYVGDGMMLHCGNPIQYTSVETTYWQNHFYCYGRIRS